MTPSIDTKDMRFGMVIGGTGAFKHGRLMVIKHDGYGDIVAVFLTDFDPWRGKPTGARGLMTSISGPDWRLHAVEAS